MGVPVEQPIDTSNEFAVACGVGVRSDELVLFLPPASGQRLTRDQALVLAAWLASLADPGGDRFARVLEAVQNT